ncbi:MAG: VCBS repeat-containing protein, partial [Pirellula sp.]|nr:VCBS repeat-containing protein [Pirellula sp.]
MANTRTSYFMMAVAIAFGLVGAVVYWLYQSVPPTDQTKRAVQQKTPFSADRNPAEAKSSDSKDAYQPRKMLDSSGYGWVLGVVKPWPAEYSLEQIGNHFRTSIQQTIEDLGRLLANPDLPPDQIASVRFSRASFLNYEGDPIAAYEDLRLAREWMETNPTIAKDFLYTIIYFQGVTAMRRGENENCIACRGESSCILPIVPAAVHTNPEGSRLAINHFTEYLNRFPEDGEVRWLLNVAYMTLGEYPLMVPKKYFVDIASYESEEHSIGRFRDIGPDVGLNRLNQAGGAIMEDFNNDGWLDIVVTSFDPTQIMGFYLNDGQGKFLDRTRDSGVANQLGGLNCVQTDYNNDGWKDIFIVRGAWLPGTHAMRPTLLRNNGDETFSDVTLEAGMGAPLNSISACWGDYDNDGWLDCFVCCEQQANRLYRNKQDGTFEERAFPAGLVGNPGACCKGANWIDFDNDGWIDIFLNYSSGEGGQLFKNQRDGRFKNVTAAMGLSGPVLAFSCWTWDYDNDGWQDLYASSYVRSVDACALGLQGSPHGEAKSCLFRNEQGRRFQDVATEVGLDGVYIAMSSNYADFDNDGWLDFYLGTGDPALATLVPNRMFRSLQGKSFADISASSGTGNLQKGHGIACGDWDRNGTVDVFIEMGGAVNGDKYHNILFQNPGNEGSWVTLRLEGQKTNRPAIGARIKIETMGSTPQTIYRHISSGSSFGANPLEQTIGLGAATEI